MKQRAPRSVYTFTVFINVKLGKYIRGFAVALQHVSNYWTKVNTYSQQQTYSHIRIVCDRQFLPFQKQQDFFLSFSFSKRLSFEKSILNSRKIHVQRP